MANLLPVAFHGDTLSLVEHNGEAFAAIKPICDAIGLDWKNQHTKLTGAGFRWNCGVITIVAADGKQRSMICIPMRKLSGWLASISAAKVKPEIRDKLIAYQDECDDALWRYWTEGHASRPSAMAIAPVNTKAKEERAAQIARDGGQFMTPARMYAIQSVRLLGHLVEESRNACPEAAAALFHAAKATALDTLARIETAEREANHA